MLGGRGGKMLRGWTRSNARNKAGLAVRRTCISRANRGYRSVDAKAILHIWGNVLPEKFPIECPVCGTSLMGWSRPRVSE